MHHTEPITLHAAGYGKLGDVLHSAFHQAARGKGKDRHADEKPFHEQSMARITQRRGIGHPLGQADKKTEEAQRMLERGEDDKAVHELLGAIIYLAGAIIHIEAEAKARKPKRSPGIIAGERFKFWIENAGRCPVEGNKVVRVSFRDGSESESQACMFNWHQSGSSRDVMGYRLAIANDNTPLVACKTRGGCCAPTQCDFNGKCLGVHDNG